MLAGCTPWPEEFARRYRAEGYWQDITLPEMLEATIRAFPNKIAIVDGDRRITYRELGQAIDRLAYGFVRRGLKPQDRVVFQLTNSAELVFAFFALLKAGIIPVMALPAHRYTEIAHFVNHAEAVGYLIPDVVRGFDYRQMANELEESCASLKQVYVLGNPAAGQQDLRAMLDEAEMAAVLATRRQPADEVALMLLSGGTTALSKMIPRTHNDYVYNCRQSSRLVYFDENTVLLAVLPMSHNYTLSAPGLLGTFNVGGKLVIAPATTPEVVFPLIAAEKVTVVCTGVPLVTSWLNSSVPEQHDLSSLKALMNGGAKLVPELRRRVEERFGCAFLESFGTGEGLINQGRYDDPEDIRLHSSGRPISPADEIRIVDEFDRDLPDGERGELLCRGPYTVRGYYKAPEANAKAFTADGFYRTGDIVKRVNGYLYVEGRKKDLVNRGGEKISCEEVENHIIAHPAVSGVCVVAMPDQTYGERSCAFVILHEGQKLTLEELVQFLLARRIAKFKLPERLEIVESFPLSPAGKILRRELRAQIAARVAAEADAAAAGRGQSAEVGCD